MLSLRHSLVTINIGLQTVVFGNNRYRCPVECAAKGPRPRYPRVWKTKKRIGTISKSRKFVECIKGLSNVKEEVYGALDSFIAWELEFPLITVKKALKSLENEKQWKRIIQVTKWMLSKGQGRTMGSYYTLLNALAEDGRIEEAEELWQTLFTQNIESMPRMFFERMISIYYQREMHGKMFEIFADMEELGIRPNVPIVTMVGEVFKKLDMLDKYEKLNRKYPPPKWEYRYIKGKRVKIRSKFADNNEANSCDIEASSDAVELHEIAEVCSDNCDDENNLYLPETLTD
ncbi:pentatricopeptide repeat-containing protein At4g21190-like [Salvia miltiorrhiza]|uniref:pentatricopeptide repeat-containing protein At4g21190-like n=1 Tax=Salvia miltiorrhiza TaxID=226208 RepID=UPI0025AC0FEB|nr:pentatricopeptide repeat-containing protein At4g21190-like [Salvia miltiorrhiza]